MMQLLSSFSVLLSTFFTIIDGGGNINNDNDHD